MRKILTINRTDEYRAKVQGDIKEEDFFYDVFCHAKTILEEIVKEQEIFLKRLEGREHSSLRIKGMGNNIITFSAERGQGKTSTMQSFAEQLRKDDTPKYEVLDSIDPSSLETDESLVRVFISRLFFSIDSKAEGGKFFKDNESLQKKQIMLKLFEKCFNNVDYIHSKGKKEYCQGELDYLAQLGDSSQLKENLYQLVKIYLDLISPNECDKKTFLVIQIDDADLSTVGVFQMCEEIRRYLSIPNVVILMAADFEQIYYAIYQNYLKQHKELIQQHSFIVKECRRMAAKYSEKIFPVGHSVNLPKIEEYITSDDNNNIFLNYATDSDEEEESNLSMDKEKGKSTTDFKNIHQQLSKELYEKTGIIILQKNNIPHPFLPLTLREITHFTKLLYDMEKIDWKVIYSPNVTEAVDAEREKLKNNLEILKNYFMHTWIINKLQLPEKEFFAGYSNQKEISLEEYWERKEDKNSFFSGNLTAACSIYLTILANQLSIAYLKDKKEQERLWMIMEDLLWISEIQTNYVQKGKYLLYRFKILTSMLDDALCDFMFIDIDDIPDDMNKHCLERFLCPIIDGKRVRKEKIFEEDKKSEILNFQWNHNVDTLELHFLNPIFSMFWKPEEVGWVESEKSNNESSEDFFDKQAEEQDKANNNINMKNEKVVFNQNDFRSIREMVTNGDLLCYILGALNHEYREVSKDNFARSWNVSYREIIEEICSGLRNKHSYLKLPKNEILQETLAAYFVKDVMNCVFLSCEENRKAYIQDCVEELNIIIFDELQTKDKTNSEKIDIINFFPWQPNILDWNKYKFRTLSSGLKINMPNFLFQEIKKQVKGLQEILQREELERHVERLGRLLIDESESPESSAETLQIEEKEKNPEQKDNQNNTETDEEDK